MMEWQEPERDMQRAKVYRAENQWMARQQLAGTYDNRAKFASLNECQAFLDRVTRKAAFTRRWPNFRMPELKPGFGARRAHANSWEISVPVWSRHPLVLLHELAHTVHSQTNPPSEAGHGWQWVTIYLQLVRMELGAEAEKTLRAEFRTGRVRVRPKREVTPAQREAWARNLGNAAKPKSSPGS